MSFTSRTDCRPSIAQGVSFEMSLMETVYTGAGFALGCGWLWFACLQMIWLPSFLWGGPLHGGAGVFLLLFIVLLAVGAALLMHGSPAWKRGVHAQGDPQKNGRAEAYDVRCSMLAHWSHAVALACLAFSFFPALPLTGIFLYIPVFCMALAGAAICFYWGGALLALQKRQACYAFTLSCLLAVFMSYGALALPVFHRPWALGLAFLAAWACAVKLKFLLLVPQPGPKRPRGRPAKQVVKDEHAGVAPTPRPLASLAGLAVFFLVAFNGHLLMPSAAVAWATELPVALGAVFCSLILGRQGAPAWDDDSKLPAKRVIFSPLFLICSGLIALSLSVLLESSYQTLAVHLLTGFLVTALLFLYAGASAEQAFGRNALAMSLAALAGNMGMLLSQAVPHIAPSALGGAVPAKELRFMLALCLALPMALLYAFSFRPAGAGRKKGAPGSNEASNGQAGNDPAATTFFTARELEILRFAAEGLSNKSIAARIHVQETTVRFHLRNIYQKSGIKDRDGLMAYWRHSTQS